MNLSTESDTWYKLNRDYLVTAFDQLYDIVSTHENQSENATEIRSPQTSSYQFKLREIESAMISPPALNQLCQKFSLSEFERDILVLCAALEVDARFSEVCAASSNHRYATFSLALSTLPSPHWSALAPDRPLRYWQLIELGSGNILTETPLHIDEKILHFLVGVQTTDPLLTRVVALPPAPIKLMPSHQACVDEIKALWELPLSQDSSPVLQLCGSATEDKINMTQAVCHYFDRGVSLLNGSRLPLNADELPPFIRRLEREMILSRSVLLLNCDDLDPSDQLQQASLSQLVEELQGFVIMTTLFPIQSLKRQIIRFDIPKPYPQEQLIAWEASVLELRNQLNGQGGLIPEPQQLSQDLQDITAQFSLSTGMIRRVCTAATGPLTTHPNCSFKQVLWQSCRVQARPGLDELAERIESKMGWDDLVLPPLQKETLQEISAHVRQKGTVYETWGFAAKNRRGLGITALFSGPSGTGKTLAAGVLANELNLDLYKIELSSVVSKYIGETEKNLQRIFDAAESGGVILLFDEADSIFGKRSEVKDSKDRYANLEVSYLLQRMESYPGLAILTTNLQSGLDPAFLRRLRFVTQFALPDAAHRAEIWRRVFPPTAPIEGLAFERLAQLNAPGGNIRNIALNAAFIAADAKEPIQMRHILRATQAEYEKLGQSLTSVEVSGWVEDRAFA